MLQRVLIIGCSGAGKSTLARLLGERLALPVVHLDTLFWKPGWVESPKAEFDLKLDQVLTGERWVIEGNFLGSFLKRAERADTIIVFDLPTITCLKGLVARLWKYFGKTRPDLPDGCPESIDWDFLAWVCNFRRNTRPDLVRKVDAVREGKTVIWFESRRQMDLWLQSLELN